MKIVKHDGYNEIFNNGGDNAPKPFYVTGAQSYGLGWMYENNGLARRIIDVVPEEMVSPGFKVSGVKDEAAFRSVWDDLEIEGLIVDALAWRRLYGGSGIVAIINDGRKLTSPAKEGGVLEGIRVYDRDQIAIAKKETNARNVRYGDPVIYEISPGDGLTPYQVHYTRIKILYGERLPPQQRKRNNGWGAPFLNKSLIEAVYDYEYCEELATQLLRRKQQAVWKVKGLAEMCDDDDAAYAARLRLAQVDDNSGVGKAIGIDANDEEYEVLNSDVNGVSEFLQNKFDRIVSLSGIHEIILKNKNVGGVSASQNTALETFYKLIDRQREEHYRPILEFLLPFVIHEQEWSVEFEPLSMPSEKEASETTKNHVESIRGALEDQMIDLEEARDTLQSIAPMFKLKDLNHAELKKRTEEQQKAEKEPGVGEVIHENEEGGDNED